MLAEKIRSSMVDIIVQGKSYKELSTKLAEDMGVRYHQAQRLIRTEMVRVGMESSLKTYADMGYSYITVLGTEDGKECGEQCSKHWHKKIPISKAQVGVDDSECGIPPFHPNCRCSISVWREDNV